MACVCSLHLIVLLGATSILEAQTQISSLIASAPMPIGSGARALGYNGAFTAIADDATAASWNPAGLIQLEMPEIAVVGSFFNRTEEYDQKNPAWRLTVADGSFGGFDLNYLSAVYPFSILRRNIVISFSYQRLYEFRRELNFSFERDGIIDTVDFHQEGGLGTLSPAIAIQVVPWLSLGATLNVWIDELGSSNAFQRELIWTRSDGNWETTRERFENTSGLNATFGIMARPLDKITLAASLDLPFRVDMDVDRWTEVFIPDPEQHITRDEQERIFVDFPLSVSFGLAWRVSDSFTTALDYSFTDWDAFRTQSAFDGIEGEVSAITGDKSSVEPTHTVRLGAE